MPEDGMKRMCAGWWAALVLMLAAPANTAWAQTLPPTEPIPRIETGMHNAQIWRIGIDASCRLMVTGSEDKTARLWALPEQGLGDAHSGYVVRARWSRPRA